MFSSFLLSSSSSGESIHDSKTYQMNFHINSNARNPLFHAVLYAVYPLYELMNVSEQRTLLKEFMSEIGYHLGKNQFYERHKLAHLAKKSELQNKFLLLSPLMNDKSMLQSLCNYLDINIIIFNGESFALFPPVKNYMNKGCIVIHQRQNKFYPMTSSQNDNHFIKPTEFVEISNAFTSYETRKKYKLRPYYSYKIDELLELAKKFHLTTQKPGRYNRTVNKTKKALYEELQMIL